MQAVHRDYTPRPVVHGSAGRKKYKVKSAGAPKHAAAEADQAVQLPQSPHWQALQSVVAQQVEFAELDHTHLMLQGFMEQLDRLPQAGWSSTNVGVEMRAKMRRDHQEKVGRVSDNVAMLIQQLTDLQFVLSISLD